MRRMNKFRTPKAKEHNNWKDLKIKTRAMARSLKIQKIRQNHFCNKKCLCLIKHQNQEKIIKAQSK